MKLAVVIAAYNEAGQIAKVVSSIPRALPGVAKVEAIVVDDCSGDETATLAAQAGAVVLRHKINRGQGAALQTAFSYVLDHGFDLAVTFDADGQHKANEIADVIRPVVKGEVDVALGSRFLERKPENLTLMRKITLKLGVIFTRFISRVDITDTHNGFRALNRQAIERIYLRHDRMEHASELIDQVGQHRLRYCEVPVTIHYSDYSMAKGQKSSNALRIAAKIILDKLLL